MRIGFPVAFLAKFWVSGLTAPWGRPKVALLAVWAWEPPSRLNLPERLEQTFLLVVLSPKVEAVGARSDGYMLLWRLGLGATYCSLGIKL